jgi:PAS domain S-box-containing protein
MKSRLRSDRAVLVAFSSAIFVLLIVGVISYRSVIISRESDRWVRHTHDVLENLENLRSAAEGVESSARGFELTGNASFLVSYGADIRRVRQRFDIIRHLTADNPVQQRKVSALQKIITVRIQRTESVMNLRKAKGLQAASDEAATGRGQAIMGQFEGVVDAMRAEELGLLATRQVQADRDLDETELVLIIGTLLGLAIVGGVGLNAWRASADRRSLEAKYRGLMEAAPDAMVVVDESGEIVLLNVQAEKQFGYSRDELLGHKVTSIIPEGFAERLIADETRSADDALEQQIGTGIELLGLRKDGSEFPIEIMLSPLESADGTLVTAAIRNITVRNAADEHLAQMEGRYRGLLEAAPDAMVVVNQSGEIVLLNAQAEKQFGYRRDELLGQKVTNIIPEGFAERLIADETRSADDALAQQIGTGIELSGLRKDGSAFPIEIMLSPLESAEGTLVTAAIRNISVRKAAEVHLGLMEGRYRGLLEAAPDAMVVVNQSGAIVLLNAQAEKQFGYSRDELLGQKVTNIIPEGFAERLIADETRSAADALAQQIGTGIELSGLRKDRSRFPIEIMLSPLESAEGTLVTAAIRNISVRKAAEVHLGQMEERYRGLLEAAPDAMVVVNRAGAIVLLNVQAEKQFGYNRDELLGQKITNIIPVGFAERLIADGTRSAADALAQQIGMGIELLGLRKNGTEFPIEIMLSPLESDDGTLVTAAIRSIATRKQAEANLLSNIEELNRSNEELAQFAYIASHDLQEPLRMIASYTQLLSKRYKGKLDPEADEFIAFAVDGANRMQRLIQDLLAYSRVGTKAKELRETSSELALERALKNLGRTVGESHATVTHDPLPTVRADETQLVQLFQNLVGNGIKYHGSDAPRIHVSAAMNGERKWIFSVRDNGLGIDAKYFERIFGMFQRLHGREEFEGTGIGLAICKKIVERHGGAISVESQPGHGSTFRFALEGSEAEL